MRAILAGVGALLAATALAAPYADSVHIPAVEKSAVDASFFPIPQDRVTEYLAHLSKTNTFAAFAGRNEELKRLTVRADKSLTVARGLATDVGPEELFDEPFSDGEHYVFLAGVASIDAYALRVSVDLSALADDEEVWVIDLIGHRPFGPYTRADHIDGGRWLPTVEGDTAVLMVRSPRPELPAVRLVGLSHFFRNLAELKVLSCNINVSCDATQAVQDNSAGVGILVVPRVNGDSALCSGALINNADTPEFEPYFLTSYHCVPEAASASQVDVVWDYRASTCGSNSTPSFSSLPRSFGESVLATSSGLDATLMRLTDVPVGDFGRTYLGWDTTAPTVGDDVVVMHHPDGSHMRISYGDVVNPNIGTPALGYRNQVEVKWAQGVTEGGSSGSNLLKVASGYRIIGTLSNGPSHVCGGSNNTDRFSSFSRFYFETDAQLYLSGTNAPGGANCPAEVALKGSPEKLDDLRAFRDFGLKSRPAGRLAVAAYYAATPWTTAWARRSETFRSMVAWVAEPMAAVGALLRAVNCIDPVG